MRRGTANMLVTLNSPRVVARLDTLTDRCDVLALQEWHGGRNAMLNDLGRIVRWLRVRRLRTNRPAARGEWTFHRARLGGGPIGVRNELGEQALTCKVKYLSGPGYVGRMPGKKSFLGPSYATRLKSRRADGSIVVRYNIHLTAGVQAGKHGYRHDKPTQRRVLRHRNERDRLERLVERDQARHGRDNVEVYGDTNYHQMPIPGLHGWWPVRPDAGTFRGRAIDGIWTSEKPDRVRFLPPLVPGEHRHVITHTKEK